MPQVRLQKFLAEAGVASRRRCEQFIENGKVSVNGQVVSQLGSKIDPAIDQVSVGGKRVHLEQKIYLALHKPAGVLCTSRDTEGRQHILDLLPRTMPRLYTVGRLDRDSEGLIFLTNDGNFSLRLTHPRYKMPKDYWMVVAGELHSAQIAELLAGVRSEGEILRAAKVNQVRLCGAYTELHVELREGKNRQIRRMLEAVGHPVKRLVRVAVGPVKLGELKCGQWRYLTNEEVETLLQQATTVVDP